jgi:hypothetical protein
MSRQIDEDDTLCGERLALYSVLSIFYGCIILVTFIRVLTSACNQQKSRSDQQYRILFFIFVLLISGGRFTYSVMMCAEASLCAIIPTLTGVKEYLLIFPGRYYVDLFFIILLYWKETFHHFVDIKKDNSLQIFFILANLVFFVLMITDAIAVAFVKPQQDNSYMIYSKRHEIDDNNM